MSRLRAALAVAAALVTLVGCASGPGVEKHVSARRTVPAAAANVNEPTASGQQGKPVDPAFAAAKLRKVDPCKLMSKDMLREFGEPADRYTGGAYTRCSNYMKDKSGKDLNISVELGYIMSFEAKKADKKIAGLASHEQKLDSGACFVSAITQDNPPMGLRMQIGYKTGDPCEVGRKVLDDIIKKIKKDPPEHKSKKGSPIELDPCAVPGEATIKDVAGDAARMQQYSLHKCGWNSRSTNMTLDFRQAYVPKDNKFEDKQTEVDLGGGVKGFQVLHENAFPTCSLIVVLLKDGTNGEIAQFEAAGPKEQTFDRCAKAQTFAKAVLPKLPKA